MSLSRQRLHQLALVAKGKCQNCGSRPLFTPSSCKRCLRKRRKANRVRCGFRPWKVGGLGRPPQESKE